MQQLHQGQACAASTAGSYNFVPQLDLAKAHFEVVKQKPARIKALLLTAKVKIMEWHDQRSFQQFRLLHMWSLKQVSHRNRCIYMYMYVYIYTCSANVAEYCMKHSMQQFKRAPRPPGERPSEIDNTDLLSRRCKKHATA